MKYNSPYVAPTLTVDVVIFQLSENGLQVLLTKRADEPFKDNWALPGGYCAQGQTTLEALVAVARRKVGIDLKVVSSAQVQASGGEGGNGQRGLAGVVLPRLVAVGMSANTQQVAATPAPVADARQARLAGEVQ